MNNEQPVVVSCEEGKLAYVAPKLTTYTSDELAAQVGPAHLLNSTN